MRWIIELALPARSGRSRRNLRGATPHHNEEQLAAENEDGRRVPAVASVTTADLLTAEAAEKVAGRRPRPADSQCRRPRLGLPLDGVAIVPDRAIAIGALPSVRPGESETGGSR